MATVKCEWLYCDTEWNDIINVIKLTNNQNERLKEFRNILKREKVPFEDIEDEWCVFDERDIEDCVEEWFFDDGLKENIYWFFNIYTGKALHIKYTTHYCSEIIKD